MEEVSISFEKNKWRGADCLSMCAVKWGAEEEKKENKNIQTKQSSVGVQQGKAPERHENMHAWLKSGQRIAVERK